MIRFSHLIYSSQNGDLLQLIEEAPGARIVVKHIANPASGGHITETSVEDFLAIDGSQPEHQALRMLLRQIASSDSGWKGAA